MTKKHFKLIAKTIASIANPRVRRQMAEYNAGICIKANPRFNRAKFMAACGI